MSQERCFLSQSSSSNHSDSSTEVYLNKTLNHCQFKECKLTLNIDYTVKKHPKNAITQQATTTQNTTNKNCLPVHTLCCLALSLLVSRGTWWHNQSEWETERKRPSINMACFICSVVIIAEGIGGCLQNIFNGYLLFFCGCLDRLTLGISVKLSKSASRDSPGLNLRKI